MALSTMASALAPLYFFNISFSREPELTPIRIGILNSFAQSTTDFTFLLLPIFPGFILSPSAPALAAIIARR